MLFESNTQMSFHKVKAHLGIDGNDRADETAKAVASGTWGGRMIESPALPDTINGVLIETQLPGTAEGEAGLWKKLTFRQHYTNHFTR